MPRTAGAIRTYGQIPRPVDFDGRRGPGPVERRGGPVPSGGGGGLLSDGRHDAPPSGAWTVQEPEFIAVVMASDVVAAFFWMSPPVRTAVM